MELFSLDKPSVSRKRRKRVGRGPGSGHGKTSSRGHKGQQARVGYSRHYGFEGGQMPLHRRLPKRGFHHDKRAPYAVVNVDLLSQCFEDGETVDIHILEAGGLIDKQMSGVKVLGRGEIAKKLTLNVQAISPGAKQKVEAAGGTVNIVAAPKKPGESEGGPEAVAAAEAQAPAAAPAQEAPPAEAAEAPAAEAAENDSESSESDQ